MNGVQFGFMYVAFEAGLGATLAALLHSLSPVLTVVLAGVLLRERVRPLQVVGLAIGVVGVMVVLGPDVDEAGGAIGITLRPARHARAQPRHHGPALDPADPRPVVVGDPAVRRAAPRSSPWSPSSWRAPTR